MALCVVGLHSHSIAHDDYPQIFHCILLSAVPFFFITSGFLLGRKLTGNPDNNVEICISSIKRYFRMYLIWILIYTPITILCSWLNKREFYLDFIEYVKGVLFVGEIAYAFPLWYLLGLCVAFSLICIGLKLKLNMISILIISFIFLAIGELYKYTNQSELCYPWNDIYSTYTDLFKSTRNGFFEGFPLVMGGVFLYKVFGKDNRWTLLIATMMLIIGAMMFNQEMPMWMYVIGGGLFLFSISFNISDNSIYKRLRVQSIWIFLLHMYFIFVFAMLDVLIPEFFICKYVFILWAVVGLLTLSVSLSLEYLRGNKGWNFLDRFIS